MLRGHFIRKFQCYMEIVLQQYYIGVIIVVIDCK